MKKRIAFFALILIFVPCFFAGCENPDRLDATFVMAEYQLSGGYTIPTVSAINKSEFSIRFWKDGKIRVDIISLSYSVVYNRIVAAEEKTLTGTYSIVENEVVLRVDGAAMNLLEIVLSEDRSEVIVTDSYLSEANVYYSARYTLT